MSVPSDAELLRRAYEEVQRLRAELARVTPECGGCLHQGGPLEECPLHGREYAYWVDGCTELSEQVGRLRAELAEEHREFVAAEDKVISACGRARRAEAAIARVRALCGADPFAHEHATLDDEKPAVYRCIPEQYVLRALDGE